MEFDAQFSADDQLIAIHDDTLDRTTDCTGPVSARTADELAKCNAAAQFEGWGFEPVVTMREILDEGRDAGWRLICEIKNIPGQPRFDHSGEAYAEALVAVVEETRFPLDRLVMICFWAPTLDAIRRKRGDIGIGFLSVPDLPGEFGMSAAQNIDFCRAHGYHLAAPRYSTPDLTKDLVASAREQGIQVHVWTANTPADIEHAVTLDLDGITSDYPDRVYEALGRT